MFDLQTNEIYLGNTRDNSITISFIIQFDTVIRKLKMIFPPIIWQISVLLFRSISTKNEQSPFSLVLSEYLNFERGFYVEIGANNGLSFSNTYLLEKNKNWKGILIEPVPHKYLECRNNRSNKNLFFNNACVPFGYSQKFVEMTYVDLMTFSSDLDNDMEDESQHFKLGLDFLPSTETHFKFGAVARTLDSILAESQAPNNIDFLSLDVEGSELEVLKGLDHSKYSFSYICIESRNFLKTNEYLELNGYSFVLEICEQNYLFKKF